MPTIDEARCESSGLSCVHGMNAISNDIPLNRAEEYVCKAPEHYNKFLGSRAEHA